MGCYYRCFCRNDYCYFSNHQRFSCQFLYILFSLHNNDYSFDCCSFIDVSQRTLSGIEIGENFVTAETLDKLISALNTTTEELFSTNHLKNETDLLEEIKRNIEYIAKSPLKLDVLYNVVKSLVKE